MLETDEEVGDEKRIEDGSLETQLFSWTGWDGDRECMIYYDPILKVQIGKHAPGTKFDCATILFDKGVLQFENYGPEIVEGHVKRHEVAYVAEYNLKLSAAKTLRE